MEIAVLIKQVPATESQCLPGVGGFFHLSHLGGFMEPLLNIIQCSELLSLSTSTIYKKTCRREIPHVKIDGALRFDPVQLREWIKEKTIKALK